MLDCLLIIVIIAFFMDLKKVYESHKQLIFQQKEDPNAVEVSEEVPIRHTPGSDGINYPPHNYHGGTWNHRISTVKDFKCRNGDLFINCYPRSGSNWIQNMIKHILELPTETIIIDVVKWFEGHTNEQLNQTDGPRMFKTHLMADVLPYNEECKYIYIARNPYDNCVANYSLVKGYFLFDADELSWKKYFKLFMDGKAIFGSWFDHVKQGYSISTQEVANVLFITYEEMKADEMGAVKKIAEFLGRRVTDSRAKEIAELTTFNKMKKDPTANHEWTHIFANEGFDFIRKGIVGDYLNYFTPEQIKKMGNELKELNSCGFHIYDDYCQ